MKIKTANGERISPTRKVLRLCNPCLNGLLLKIGTHRLNECNPRMPARTQMIGLMRGRDDLKQLVADFDSCGCVVRPYFKKTSTGHWLE